MPPLESGTLRVRFWGVRGSAPAASAETLRGGGHTPCVEVRAGGEVMIFDAGSGLHPLGLALEAEGVKRCHLFFSHCHYDHIIGLPALPMLYDPAAHLKLWSGHLDGAMGTEAMVHRFLQPPFLPAAIERSLGPVAFKDFRPGDVLDPSAGIAIATHALHHPGGCIGYRVNAGGKSVTYLTDLEHTPGVTDTALVQFIEASDLLIYDAMFSEAEFARCRGFGHSTWEEAVRIAALANVRRLALFHHSPRLGDDALDAVERAAREKFAGAFAARDGMKLAI